MRWLDRTTASDSRGRIGRLQGSAEFQLIPLGNFTAELEAEDLAISPAYQLFSAITEDGDRGADSRSTFNGELSGRLKLSGPLENFSQIENWTVAANLVGSNLTINDGQVLTIATGPVSIEDSKISAPDIRLGSPSDPSVRLAASLNATIAGPTPFEFELRGDDVPLMNLFRLATIGEGRMLEGKLDVDLRGSGQLTPSDAQPSWSIAGRVASPNLAVGGVQLGTLSHRLDFDANHFSLTRLEPESELPFIIENVSAKYNLSEQEIELRELLANIFGGTLTGTAQFARDETGIHQLNLGWQDVKPVIDTGAFLPAAVELTLSTSGQIEWEIPADSVALLATHRGQARIIANPIELGDEKLGSADLSLQVTQEDLILRGSGSLFGGEFEIDTEAPLTATTQLKDLFGGDQVGSRSTAKISSLQLGRVQGLVMPQGRRYQGSLSGEFTYASVDQILKGRFIGNGVGIDGVELVQRFVADVSYGGNVIDIESFRGEVADGRFEASGRVAVSPLRGQPFRGRLNTRISAVNLSKALLFVSPAADQWADGRLSGSIAIDVDRVIRAEGAITVLDNEYFQIPVGQTHATLSASLEPRRNRWQVRLAAIEGNLGRGKISGDLVVKSSAVRPSGFDLESDWRAKRLDYSSLFMDAGSIGGYARGQLDGQLTLNGQGIQSVNDLQGRYDARLGGTEARAVPGLISLQSYLGAFSLAGTTFDAGRARGTIGGGVLRVDEFWLSSDRARVWADGRVRLAGGQLDIEAVVQTGSFETQNLALLALAETAAIPAGIPLGAIIEVNRLASNRTLYLELVGPLSRPRVRVRPLDTFRENAAQILIREAAAVALPFGSFIGSED